METPPKSLIHAKRKAFTLVELLAALGIVVVLAAVLVPAARSVYASSTDAASAHCIAQLNAAAQSYLAENGMIYWPYISKTNGGTQWWFGFEPGTSLSAPEGSRWLDLNQGPLGPYIAASGGMSIDPAFRVRATLSSPSMAPRILPTDTISSFRAGTDWHSQVPAKSPSSRPAPR